MADSEIQSNWSEIPEDILLTIAKTLKIYSDYIRLRAVCHNWQTTLPSTPPHTLPSQLPWLLRPLSPPSVTPHCNTSTITNTNSRRTIYKILTNKLHTLSFQKSSAYPRCILRSSHCYLIISSGSPDIFYLNPLTNSKALIPSFSSLPSVVSFSFSNVGQEHSIKDQYNNQIYFLDLQQMRDEYFRKIVLSSPPKGSHSPTFVIIPSSSLNQDF